MKTLFQLGFPAQRRFWVGQPTGTITSGSLDYATGLYPQILAWLAKTADPASWLGPDYAKFQQTKAIADNLNADASSFAETLDTGGTLSDAENNEANQYYDAVTIAWGIISQHPTPQIQAAPAPAPVSVAPNPAAQPTTAQQITSAAAQAAKALGPKAPVTPAKPAVAPAPAAADLTTPLLIGGGAVALLLVVLSVAK